MDFAADPGPERVAETLVIIPARLGATRLPRKPLRLLAQRPLVARVWERVEAMGIAARCVIATDSAEIADAMAEFGAEVAMTSADHPSGTDRVAEVASRSRFAGFQVIVNVQGDEPFISREAVAGAAALVASGRFALGTVAALAPLEVLGNPNVVKVVAADDGRAMYFSRAAIPFLREAQERSVLSGLVRQHIGVYAYSREALMRWVALPPHPLEQVERLEQLRPLAAGIAMGVTTISEAPRPGIDTEDDLVRANAEWTAFTVGTA
ncbi:MAG: 3-deoxy-manno-octulosonate cytidylyltransferase [Gemmatimonadetes bacterium]|nr:3-deoxy-manno-octulosonate cytidylyltransferase [Gemmatimonadota bacterium]